MNTRAAFAVNNLFSIATRERCIMNLKTLPLNLQRRGRIPEATAAVLIPFCKVNDVASLLFTVRAGNLRAHSGQISFPGGKTDDKETPVQTALRETEEEIGLSPSRVDVWGLGPALPGRDNEIMVTPVVGSIMKLGDRDLNINRNEVAEAFAVPIETLCDPKHQFYTQFNNGFILPVFVIEKYKIWGLTAFITHAFLSALMPKDIYHNDWLKKKIVISDYQ